MAIQRSERQSDGEQDVEMKGEVADDFVVDHLAVDVRLLTSIVSRDLCVWRGSSVR